MAKSSETPSKPVVESKDSAPDDDVQPAAGRAQMTAAPESAVPDLNRARVPAGPLSWRPLPGDMVLVAAGDDESGEPAQAPAVVTFVKGQLPGGHRGWLVDVEVFGARGGVVESLALFGSRQDAESADPSGPTGWVRR